MSISNAQSVKPGFLQLYLLIPGDASVHCSIYDPVQAHAERVNVALMLPVLVLADQSPQLLGLVLHHVDGVLNGTHLHLQAHMFRLIKEEDVHARESFSRSRRPEVQCEVITAA